MKSIAIASFVLVSLISCAAHASKVRALHAPSVRDGMPTTASWTCAHNTFRSVNCGVR